MLVWMCSGDPANRQPAVSLTHPGSFTKLISIKQTRSESVDSHATVCSKWNLGGGQAWHRLSLQHSTTAEQRTLTAQKRQTPAKFTDRSLSLCSQDISAALSRLSLSGDSDWHGSCCFPALCADKITNCQPARICEQMLTAPLRIYALVSLKSCSNLCNCPAFVD